MSSKNKQVKGLLLKIDNVVVCEVEEIQAELGEPDCRITHLIPSPVVGQQSQI